MKKLIKNYTTEIPVHKTIAEIQRLLGENGATGVAFDYDGQGGIKSVYFRINFNDRELPFRLPAKEEEVYKTLFADMIGQTNRLVQIRKEKAKMIAWRVCKLWLEAQLTHVNLGQAKIEEVFLPYLVTANGKTLYESMIDTNFQLTSGH
jgi:hypothetical protein